MGKVNALAFQVVTTITADLANLRDQLFLFISTFSYSNFPAIWRVVHKIVSFFSENSEDPSLETSFAICLICEE